MNLRRNSGGDIKGDGRGRNDMILFFYRKNSKNKKHGLDDGNITSWNYENTE